MPSHPPHRFHLTITAQTGTPHAPFVRSKLRRARSLLTAPLTDLNVVFINDSRMIELHDQFMSLPTTTDVLTFPIDEDDQGRPLTGEVYVCIPEARRQARARKVPVRDEVLLYALHGMLHLCGFDDRTDAEYRRMHDREDAILIELGVGRVFESRPPARRLATAKRTNPSPRRRTRIGGDHA